MEKPSPVLGKEEIKAEVVPIIQERTKITKRVRMKATGRLSLLISETDNSPLLS